MCLPQKSKPPRIADIGRTAQIRLLTDKWIALKLVQPRSSLFRSAPPSVARRSKKLLGATIKRFIGSVKVYHRPVSHVKTGYRPCNGICAAGRFLQGAQMLDGGPFMAACGRWPTHPGIRDCAPCMTASTPVKTFLTGNSRSDRSGVKGAALWRSS